MTGDRQGKRYTAVLGGGYLGRHGSKVEPNSGTPFAAHYLMAAGLGFGIMGFLASQLGGTGGREASQKIFAPAVMSILSGLWFLYDRFRREQST
ncbi:hypothetical protein HO173_009958 [Letharia columbiana]|uniref:Uncharacterized protein n=1 Tax=Letharia columbiana TaxID=112416 RepID=A0A8H6FNQ1_9LECA|nr:uncharacterized protein HO173_009958 [Letharia columbiana]KAF6231875.1 hypothetical protein HO173_009958 [Letharia columbiana]